MLHRIANIFKRVAEHGTQGEWLQAYLPGGAAQTSPAA